MFLHRCRGSCHERLTETSMLTSSQTPLVLNLLWLELMNVFIMMLYWMTMIKNDVGDDVI